MKSLSPIDVTVLTWLKPELDGTLQQARAALERFAEEGEGPAALRECFGHLHQAAGTLGMVELTGSARLAEEMEQLAAGLADGSVPGSDSAYTLLMQCIVQLPDYLERLQNGNRDVPAVLLPLINELRSIRGEPALGEESVYSAPTQHPLPGAAVARIQAAAAGEDIAGLSLQFQAHLQRWLAADDPQAAGNLGEVCLRIAAQSRDDADRKLFWVASALLDALAVAAVAADAALKRSLTKVDQEVNHLNNRGIGEIRQLSPVRITQELLYFVSRNASATDRLAEVEAAFELASLVPDEDEIRHAKSSLLGRNNALLDSVAAVIKEDILKVKDSLDLAIRQSDKNPADMAAVLDVLTRVENTLALIDAEGARRHIHENRETIRAYVEGRSALSDAELMEIAKSLLSVESMLDQHGGESAASRQAQMAGEFLSSAQSHQLLDALIRESIVNFLQVRQAFVAFVESYWDHQQLEPIPGLLKQVSGALAILEYTPVSNYIDAVSAYTRVELIERQGIPGAEQMERLAEVLASIEYYLESVRDRRPNRERILDITEKGLEALQYWPLPEQPAHVPSAPPPVAAPVMAESAPAPVPEKPQPVSVAAAVITVSTSDAHGDAVSGFDMEAEGIDDEIREIFLEEFAEERTNLDGFYADWRGDPDNIELVRPIRRVFHTLKGSGRLVGAKALSEFSWKIESLLNRVLDGSRPASGAVLAMVGTAVETLPRFQKALLGERATVDMQGLCDVAERLAAGEDVIYQPKPASVVPASEPEVFVAPVAEAAPELPQAAPAEPVIDPVLLEILRPEIGGHLETLNAWLTRSAASGHAEFEDAVFRAIHTMNGAFAMSEVGTLAGVLAPAEALVRRGIAHHASADSEILAGLAQVADAVQATLDDLSANTAPSTYPDLEAWIAALRDRLPDIPLSVPTPAAMADIDAQRLEAEQLEAERIEAERIEAVRLEAEHLETQRLLAERLSAEAAAAEAAAAEAAAAEAAAAEAAAAEAAAAEAAAAEAAAA
ncbi:MAG: Hpt domain-containing protein, partial [Arenimonas sp.]|nr:Hpt domain-containing protein [Arenimonas sp.]